MKNVGMLLVQNEQLFIIYYYHHFYSIYETGQKL